MLEQGPSVNQNLMEWDKLWAINKQILDPITPRFMAVAKKQICKVTVTNFGDKEILDVLVHPKTDMGKRAQVKSKNLYIGYDDAVKATEGEKITFVNLGNIKIISKKQVDDHFEFVGEALPDDKDFKNTVKITWISADQKLVEVDMVELDHIIKVAKLDEETDIQDVVNKDSRFVT